MTVYLLYLRDTYEVQIDRPHTSCCAMSKIWNAPIYSPWKYSINKERPIISNGKINLPKKYYMVPFVYFIFWSQYLSVLILNQTV